ncbi:MAG TPA: hypothetical protein DCR40_20620 [Prolixibacteraceae bacterium]|nr:hypothetical protein [Prolixibacteraceae bacterium]
MKNLIRIAMFCSFFLTYPYSVYPQEENKTNAPKFFLDCHECDFTFVRQKLPFISFVRDPKLADVHLLVSDSKTGSGGKKYFLNFIGLRAFEGQDHQYEFIANQSDTEDDIRNGLLKYFKIGILHYYSKTSFLNDLEIDLKEKSGKPKNQLLDDPWKLWVFQIRSGGEFQKEESQNEYSLQTEIRTDKITDAWKTRIEASYGIRRENYFDDGESFTNKQDEKQIQANFIKSLSSKWSYGIFAEYSANSYLNISNSFSLDGAVEYNFFPWAESNRRVFSLAYAAGLKTYDYKDETIYGKMSERLPFEALRIKLELVQPWGTIETSLEGRHFMNDFSKNRLTLESDFSVRLTKQLSVYSEIQSEIIHDQLYLPKGDSSVEDLLLKRRKLATTYEIRCEFGIRFTFGSAFNNIVNERF